MSNQVELGRDQILSLVRTVSPGAQIGSLALFAGEHANLNYDLRATNPSREMVLKVYVRDRADRAPWKETHLLRLLLSETGVPVPQVLHFDDSCVQIPYPWALHTRLPGLSLSHCVDSLDGWELGAVGYEMGRYLGHMHQIRLAGFGEFFGEDPHKHPTEHGCVLARTAEWLEVCAKHALLPPEMRDQLFRRLARTDVLNRHQAHLLHGDYRAENIIVQRGATGYHVTGVVEFEYATGGSPELDVSKLFNSALAGMHTFQKDFLDGYAESGELAPGFWDRLRIYQTYACLERLVSAHQRGRSQVEEECRQRLARDLRSPDPRRG